MLNISELPYNKFKKLNEVITLIKEKYPNVNYVTQYDNSDDLYLILHDSKELEFDEEFGVFAYDCIFNIFYKEGVFNIYFGYYEYWTDLNIFNAN